MTAGASGVSAHELRTGMAQFASGVTVVTTVLGEVRHAMTATAFSSVSLAPPLVLVCVGKSSRFHDAVLTTGSWAVSVLAAEQRGIADHFAHSGRDLVTQFDGLGVDPGPWSGSPVLRGALTWLDCSTWAVQDAGDHTVVLGLVRAVAAPAEPPVRPALTYHRGSYRGQ